MSEKEILSLALNSGKILLENGAETYRIEDTMLRIMKHYKLENAEAFVTTTGIFVSNGTETMVSRVKTMTINLNKIAKVNELSRNIVADKLSLDEAVIVLKNINELKPYPKWLKIISIAVSCSSFSFIFGGNFSDCLNALIVGFVLAFFLIFIERKKVSEFMTSITGGAIVAVFALIIINFKIGNNLDKVIIGCLMPLVPGVGLTNAIRDIIEGDYLSGSGRIFDALLIGTSIATGVGAILKVWFSLFGGGMI